MSQNKGQNPIIFATKSRIYMITIIAEKPSVVREIAAIVRASSRRDGYFDGNGYMVTWAYGHLVGPDAPEKYGWSGTWDKRQLPMIPEKFTVSPLETTDKDFAKTMAKQLKVIADLFKKAEKIIVATDAGREGEGSSSSATSTPTFQTNIGSVHPLTVYGFPA